MSMFLFALSLYLVPLCAVLSVAQFVSDYVPEWFADAIFQLPKENRR